MIKRILVLASQRKKSQEAIVFFSKYPSKYKISGLMCSDEKKLDFFKKQIKEIRPDIVFFPTKDGAEQIIEELNIRCFYDYTQYNQFLKASNCDLVISDLVGIDSIKLILATIGEYKDLCLLNLEPIIYSGKIIINEVKNKGVKIQFVTHQFFSFEQFQKHNKESINKVILTDFESKYEKENLDNYTYPSGPLSEFKKILYFKNKMWLARHLIAFSYFYNLDLEKFEFYKSNTPSLSLIFKLNNGCTIFNIANNNKELIYNHYFIDNLKTQNSNLDKVIDIKLQKILDKEIKSLDLATKALLKGGTYPLLYQMAYDLSAEAIYYNRTKDKNLFFKLFEDLLKDKTYYSKNINIQTIFAIHQKLKTKIETVYLKKTKEKPKKISKK
ncbi:MAG TPA: hypothetical protein PK655_02615 [archaeon]|jgi:1-deoxy-D-xylulose 5-phosphate reductoisomerase|nr:hypothetical protein [archaeon]HPV66324.1 hypothetical protein [archaeon]